MLAAFFPLVAEARTRPAPATTAATTKPAKIVYGKGRQIGTLANKRINESSGLASGRVNQGVLWTHNDSGDGPHLYAFNFKGEHLATCRISGAAASDWEDLCSFRRGNRDVLLVGDVGDNNRRRDHCTLYAVFEPRLGPRARKSKDRPYLLRSMRTIHYRYRQGPQDCESIAVDPTTQTIYIVTKVLFGRCRVYALPWPKGLARKPIVIEPVATLPIPLVTGMDISPDGRRAVILTYGHAREYTRVGRETWGRAFARRGRLIRMPRRRQGESICYGPDGATLYLTSERVPAVLLEVPVLKTVRLSVQAQSRPAVPATQGATKAAPSR